MLLQTANIRKLFDDNGPTSAAQDTSPRTQSWISQSSRVQECAAALAAFGFFLLIEMFRQQAGSSQLQINTVLHLTDAVDSLFFRKHGRAVPSDSGTQTERYSLLRVKKAKIVKLVASWKDSKESFVPLSRNSLRVRRIWSTYLKAGRGYADTSDNLLCSMSAHPLSYQEPRYPFPTTTCRQKRMAGGLRLCLSPL